MKKILGAIFAIAIAFSLSSCISAHMGLPHNVNNNTTNVVLQGGNYEIIQRVEGSATGTLLFGFIPLNSQTVVNNARSQMLQSANLVGSSRAIINETVEKEVVVNPFVGRRIVTISAYVIEWRD